MQRNNDDINATTFVKMVELPCQKLRCQFIGVTPMGPQATGYMEAAGGSSLMLITKTVKKTFRAH